MDVGVCSVVVFMVLYPNFVNERSGVQMEYEPTWLVGSVFR